MNPLTAAWISTIGHVLCATALVALVIWAIFKYEGRNNGRWFS